MKYYFMLIHLLFFTNLMATECELRIAGYNVNGTAERFAVLDLTREQSPSQSLKHVVKIQHVNDHRAVVMLPLQATGTRFRFKLQGGGGELIYVTFPLLACGQTNTVVFGQRSSDEDTHSTEVRGKLASCKCDETMWVRMIPMFGGLEPSSWGEAEISRPDCKFQLFSTTRGTRQILIFGSGNRSLNTSDIQIIHGTSNDVGLMNVSLEGCEKRP